LFVNGATVVVCNVCIHVAILTDTVHFHVLELLRLVDFFKVKSL